MSTNPNIWDLVIADMRGRHEFGMGKYGKPLRAFDGRITLVDAYEEALDLAVYLKKEIVERKALEAKNARPVLDEFAEAKL